MASLSALAPVLHEMLDRGDADNNLDKLSNNVMDGIHTLTLTNAAITHKRTDIHKPYMKPEFVRAIAKVKEADKDPAWLYGKAVESAVQTYEKTRKAARGAMRDTQSQAPQKKTGSNQSHSNKKAKYGKS